MKSGAPLQTGTGQRLTRLELDDVWMVDPLAGREGPASLLVEGGRISSLVWRRNGTRNEPDVVVVPGLFDLHAHFREPGRRRAETIASGQAAAAHGGFTTVCVMANTDPPADSPQAILQTLASAEASGSAVRVLPFGTITSGRAGVALAPLAELANVGAIGFSDDGSPVVDPSLFRQALSYSAAFHRPIVEHPEEPELAKGGEAHEGLGATILGLRGIPSAAETTAVARDIEILAEVVRQSPADARPRLHLTHLSCASSIELVRRAKAAGLPITCDITPHHLALHDGWLGGDQRLSWQVKDAPWAGGPADAAPFDSNTRVNPPLRSAADAVALAAGISDGTVDAIATDHAPHTETDKAVEFGDAATGISGIETALGLVLEAVESGVLDLMTAVRALTAGPASVVGRGHPNGNGHPNGSAKSAGQAADADGRTAFELGAAADLVVIDRSESWHVTAESLLSKGKNTPLLGSSLPGRVLLTIAGGRVAYLDPDLS
jgi:dihydroorotase